MINLLVVANVVVGTVSAVHYYSVANATVADAYVFGTIAWILVLVNRAPR